MANVLEFQLQHQSCQFRLISFRIDSFDLLAVQGTHKSLLQHYTVKASILGAQPFLLPSSHIHTWLLEKPELWLHAPVSVMSLLLNMLSRLVIAFLPRSKHLLISWLQSPPAVILEPPQIKICHCFYFFPFYLPWSDGIGFHDVSFLIVEF